MVTADPREPTGVEPTAVPRSGGPPQGNPPPRLEDLWSFELPRHRRGLVGAQLNREIAIGIGLVVVGLTAWIAYLAWTLPDRYVARQWNLVWVGFDVVLTAVLAYAGWAAWFRRRVMIVTAVVAGTLLCCDAWFDVLTSIGNRDAWLNIVTAVAAELPAAGFFFWVARRILVRMVATVHDLGGSGQPLLGNGPPTIAGTDDRRLGGSVDGRGEVNP